MAEAPTDAVPLSALAATVWRHRFIAAAAGCAVLAGAVLLSFTVTPLYRAEALLVVERGGKPLAFLQDDADAKGAEFSLLNTQSELLQSHQVLRQVLESEPALFAASPAYSRSKDPVQLLSDRLKVETNQYNWIVHVSLVDPDQRLAQDALGSLIRCHLENERRRLEERSRSALEFLRQAGAKAREDLGRSRAEEAQFRRSNGILSADPDRNQLTAELDGLNAARTALVAELATSDATMQGLAAADAAAAPGERQAALLRVPEIHRDPQVVQAQQGLAALRDRAFSLSQKYKPAHPQMLDVAKQIESAETQLAQAVAAARSAIADNHQALLRRHQQLKEHVAAVEAGLATYRERLIDLQALSLKTASAEQLFQTVDRNLQEEEIASHRQQAVVTVADPPHVTSWPVNVRRSLFGLAGLFLGAIAGVGAALVAELLDRRIRHPDAVRQITGLPTLGMIPHVEGLGVPGRPGTPEPAGDAAVHEAFRLLSSTIQLSREPEQGPRVLVVTSPGSGDGRTTVAARLALTLGASGSHVLLIDGDLRQPALHRQFGLPPQPGVSDLLQGREAVVESTGHPRLELLMAGTPADHSMELPTIAAFRELLKTFAGGNRFVIIDSPPLEFSEALVMCGVASDILVVIRDGYTAKEALRLAQMRLGPLQGKILGLVINDDHGTQPVSRGADNRIAQTGVFRRRKAQTLAAPPLPAALPPRRTTSSNDPVVIEGLDGNEPAL